MKKKVKPLENIELPEEKDPKKKFILVMVLLLIGMFAFTYGMLEYLKREPGWQRIETTENVPIAGDFVFQYNLTENPNAEFRAASNLYTDTLKKGYILFDINEIDEKYHNIAYINAHPNEIIEIEEELYNAFKIIDKYQDKGIYYAPIYYFYNQLFVCNDDYETEGLDPYNDQELANLFKEIIQFIDEDKVELELLDDNQVRLNVDKDYANFLKDYEIEYYIDFYWYKNAFIVDMISDAFTGYGYNKGTVSTTDGFVCRFDDTNEELFSYIYDREDNIIRDVATMYYTKPISMVIYRDYAIEDDISDYYYQYQNGVTRTAYIDLNDGLCKNSISNLMVYSNRLSCSEVLLSSKNLYINDEFNIDEIDNIKNINYIYTINRVIYYNDSNIRIDDLFDQNGVTYQLNK